MAGRRPSGARPPLARSQDFLRTKRLAAELDARKRALPWPSTLNGVVWGAFYETTVARRLPRTAFEPPPSVDAGVLVFRRRAEPLIPPELASGYRRFVACGFRRGLHAVVPRRNVRRIGGGGASARDLDAHQWAVLFRGQGTR